MQAKFFGAKAVQFNPCFRVMASSLHSISGKCGEILEAAVAGEVRKVVQAPIELPFRGEAPRAIKTVQPEMSNVKLIGNNDRHEGEDLKH